MKTHRTFARAKDWNGRKVGSTTDVTNRPDYLAAIVSTDNVASVTVKHQGGRQDALVKIKGVSMRAEAGTLTSKQS